MTRPDVLDGLSDRGRPLGLEGVCVTVGGQLIAERRWAADIRRDVFSVSKTVTSLAVGMLVDDGRVDLEAPAVAYLPGLRRGAAAGADTITVRHLLSMTAGNGYRWADEDADHAGDPAADFFATPLVAVPGTEYHYAGANSYVLGRIVHAVSGLDLRDFLVPRLFDPLGIRNPQWLRCPLGFPLGAIGLHLRTSEIARIADLLLARGGHDGRQLVSGDYVDAMVTDVTATGREHPDNREYGLHVWRCARDRAYRMDGIYGQFGIVIPERAACVAVSAHYLGPTTDILDLMWERVVPALGG